MVTSEEFISVGKISGAFGVKGWIKVYSYTEPRTNILQYSPLYMSRQGEWVAMKVIEGRAQGKGIVMSIANVTDCDQVQPLIGAELAIRKTQLAPVDDDEFYWRELVGLEVLNGDNESLGQVDHLFETGAQDVLVVQAESGEQRLIPFVMDEIIKSVDLDRQLIQVNWGKDF